VLCNGLARLEYRGYDSAGESNRKPNSTRRDHACTCLCVPGIGIDGDGPDSPLILFKEVGKVAALRKHIAESYATPAPSSVNSNGNSTAKPVDMTKVFFSQTSFAHTRWATHGIPAVLNCHPHVSDALTEFSLVHSR
jgi:glucosamine--fructose-6-phosphate aminotransferase (isomerizing)